MIIIIIIIIIITTIIIIIIIIIIIVITLFKNKDEMNFSKKFYFLKNVSKFVKVIRFMQCTVRANRCKKIF